MCIRDSHDVEHADILAKQDEDKGKSKGDASKGSTGHNAKPVIEPSKDQLPENANHGIQGDAVSYTHLVGIGLALSGMIIKEQKGTILASNREDGGARFCIRFYKGAV